MDNNVISLYDFNKTNMAQIEPYSLDDLDMLVSDLAQDLWSKAENCDRRFWMLLCRERNDYTIFWIYQGAENVKSGVLDCLNNRGNVIDLTQREDGNYEIWIRDFVTNENFVYYLFDYTDAIVEA